MEIKRTADLQKSNSCTLQITQISSLSDLLKCKSMYLQAKQHGTIHVLTHIRISVEKCAFSLGIGLSDTKLASLCQDLFERYKHESIEDVITCLKDGRQGKYGFGHNSRDRLNMILLNEWMTKHLEQKSIAREKEYHNSQMTDKGVTDPYRNTRLKETNVKDTIKSTTDDNVFFKELVKREKQNQSKDIENQAKEAIKSLGAVIKLSQQVADKQRRDALMKEFKYMVKHYITEITGEPFNEKKFEQYMSEKL